MPGCPSCGASYVTTMDLDKHTHEHHPALADAPPDMVAQNRCKVCGDRFESDVELADHALAIHDLPS